MAEMNNKLGSSLVTSTFIWLGCRTLTLSVFILLFGGKQNGTTTLKTIKIQCVTFYILARITNIIY